MSPVFVLVSSVEVCSLERLPKALMLRIDVGVSEGAGVPELVSV